MERLFEIRAFTVIFSLAVTSMAANAKESEKEGDNYHMKQTLIIGLHDSMKSNYFYDGMIAGEAGTKADGIDQAYNTIIAENIVASVGNGDCKLIPASATQVTGQVLNEIEVNRGGEDCYSDLSTVSTKESRRVLDNADADYLLVLNQYYLRWQDQPLCTLFHIVSYTPFDKDKNGVYRGNNFLVCMSFENPDKLRKSSCKSSSRIVSSIVKTLDED